MNKYFDQVEDESIDLTLEEEPTFRVPERNLWLSVINTFMEDARRLSVPENELREELNSEYIKHICKCIDFDYGDLVHLFNEAINERHS